MKSPGGHPAPHAAHPSARPWSSLVARATAVAAFAATSLLLAAPARGDSAADAEARDLYAATCVTCHGPEGKGDGLAAVGLPTKPQSFADPAWQRATSDEEIDRAIVKGGAAVGKSPLMPPNPQLADRPAVVAAMRAMIRGFGRSDVQAGAR